MRDVTRTACAAALLAGLLVPATAAAATPTRAAMVGQRMLVAFKGTTPSAGLLARIRAGQVGGVVLFSRNVRDARQLTALVSRLQAAARAGGRPRLIVATDQEGGLVRRIPWAAPRASAQELGRTTPAHVRAVGRSAGVTLRACGVNLDLAPVADVPRLATNFLLRQHRAFATRPDVVAADAAAFARGLEAGHVLPALKHFPGLGRAGATSTDTAVVRIGASAAQIGADLAPYRTTLREGVRPVIMLSTAIYPAYSPRAAAWSRAIAGTLLRVRLAFRGVTVTDSLTAAAAVRGTQPGVLAVKSARVGVDLLLVTGSGASARATYAAVLAAANSGTIGLADLRASYSRIRALKARM